MESMHIYTFELPIFLFVLFTFFKFVSDNLLFQSQHSRVILYTKNKVHNDYFISK